MNYPAKLSIVSGLCLAVLATGAMAQNRTELRLAHHMPLTNHMHTSAEQLAEYFNERSENYEIRIFGGGQLFTEKALVDALVSGGLDMGFTTASWWGSYAPTIHVLNAPMLLNSYEKAHAALGGKMGEALASEVEKSGVKVIGWMHSGIDAALVNTIKPIQSADDFQGLRIRTSFPMVAAVLDGLGSGSVVMSSSEVYTALQRGTFDGTFTGAPSVVDRKWVEVTDYGTYLPFYFSAHPIAVAGDIFAAMPEEEQALLIEAAQVAGQASAKRAEENEASSWEIIRAAYEVVELPDDDIKKIEDMASTVAIDYLKEVAGDRGVEIYELAREDISQVE